MTLWTLQERVSPYLMVAPFVVLFLTFMAYPLGRSLVLSFQKSAGPSDMQFVGLANYRFLIQDPQFWKAVRNTVMYAVCFLAIQLPAALLLAILLNHPKIKFRNFFRFGFFSTHLVGGAFVAVIFNIVLGGRSGMVNQLWSRSAPGLATGATAVSHYLPGFLGDRLLHLRDRQLTADPFGFLTNPDWTLPMLVVIALWLSIGYAMIYFLAALQSVDRELYEAADVDGASKVQQFFHVTVPGIRPVAAFLLLVGTVGALQLFELPYVLFAGSGPDGRGLTIVMYLYQSAFEQGNLGYASACGWGLVVMVSAVTILQLAMNRRKGV